MVIIFAVDDLTARIDELAGLMEEFSLVEAELAGPDWRVAFKRATRAKLGAAEEPEMGFEADEPVQRATESVESKPSGTPVTSPMNGIYYNAPSPSSPPFVRVGEMVMAGQVVGLIEAMKVFNEIVAPVSGTVERMVAETGQLVQPGEALLFIS